MENSGWLDKLVTLNAPAVQKLISKQCVQRVLVKVQEHKFGVVDKNCEFQEPLYSVYSLRIWVSMLTKFNRHENWSLMTMDGEESSVEIQRCINEIQPHLCKILMENFDKRVRTCQRSRGGRLPDVLFHT